MTYAVMCTVLTWRCSTGCRCRCRRCNYTHSSAVIPI